MQARTLSGQGFADGDSAFDEHLETVAPIGEVGEADDGVFGDAEHFGKDVLREFDDLEGLAEDDVVVALVFEEGETFVEVELDDADAAGGGGDDVDLVEGDSESGDVFLFGEVLHEGAVS